MGIVVYVLAVLGGAERTVYSEDIAAKCYELEPSRFCWRLEKYRERGWPDKYIAKTALEDAKKEEYGRLVEGSYALDLSRDGWRLTPSGGKWFLDQRERVERSLGLSLGSLPLRDAERFLRQFRAEPMFQRYFTNRSLDGLTRYDLTDFLSCAPDAPADVITRKFDRLRAMAELSRNQGVLEFLDACVRFFPELKVGT